MCEELSANDHIILARTVIDIEREKAHLDPITDRLRVIAESATAHSQSNKSQYTRTSEPDDFDDLTSELL